MWDKDREFGFVYFVEAPAVKRVKIGVAVDVRARLNELRCACPIELSLLGFVYVSTWNKARKLEQRLHKEFEPYCVRGEWFEINSYILNRLEELCGLKVEVSEEHWRIYPTTPEECVLSALFSED